MNHLLVAGTAIAVLVACDSAMAQPLSAGAAPPTFVPFYSGARTTVDLGEAGHFVILSETGITDVPSSPVVGNVGTSPITGAADHLSCAEVTGTVYSVDDSGPSPCNLKAPTLLTTAVGDMQSAYSNAAGRHATTTNLGAGNIGGLTLAPGVYSWSTNVNVSKDVILNGGSHAIWIFQIAKDLIVAGSKAVVLHGFAQSQNVFWQVACEVSLGSKSHMEGIVLSKTMISMGTGASINGRLLAQTAVTLQMDRVTAP